MGSGKSKTGAALARKLGFDFLDTDQIIELNSGRSISEIFSTEGEDFFRKEEAKVVRTLEGKKNLVVATGGGMPCFSGNMSWMNEHGYTVYLKVPVGMLIQRLQQSVGNRPILKNLSGSDLKEQIEAQLLERESFYSQAKLIFDAGSLDLNLLIEKIKKGSHEFTNKIR